MFEPSHRSEQFHECARTLKFGVAVRPDDEQPRRVFGDGDVFEQLQAPLVGPLQVVEDQYDGVSLAERGEERDHCGEQHVAFGVRVCGLRGRQIGHALGQVRDQADQL